MKATLGWSDVEGSPYPTSGSVLVNDLSLLTVSASTGTSVGNHRLGRAELRLASGAAVTFAHVSFGSTLDITPPLVAPVGAPHFPLIIPFS